MIQGRPGQSGIYVGTASEFPWLELGDLRGLSSEGFVLRSTPIGVLIIPVIRGKQLSDQDLAALPDEMRNEIEKKREKYKRLSFYISNFSQYCLFCGKKNNLNKLGGKLVMANLNDLIYEVFEISGFVPIFTITDSLEDAYAEF